MVEPQALFTIFSFRFGRISDGYRRLESNDWCVHYHGPDAEPGRQTVESF